MRCRHGVTLRFRHRGNIGPWADDPRPGRIRRDHEARTGEALDGPAIVQAARRGEAAAAETFSAYVDRLGRAIELILSELARIKDKPVGDQELRRAKDYAIGQLRIGLESTSNQMMWVGENLMSYGRFIQPSEVVRKIEAVSDKDIHRVAGEVLNSRSLSVAMVTPGGGDKHAHLIREKMAILA